MKKVILLTEGLSTYARQLLDGLSEYSRINGPWAFYRESLIPFYRAGQSDYLPEHIKSLNAHGVIVRASGPKMAQAARSLGLPAVACDDNNLMPEVPNIVSDYEAVGKMAAEDLLARGFKNFGYCGFDDMYWSVQRQRFFKHTVEKAGCRVNVYSSPKRAEQNSGGQELASLAQWVSSLPKPAAVMACNDDRANQVITSCNITGINIPEEVAVLGVDNDSLLCTLSNPHLSSIALDARKAGFKAAALLDRMMSGQEAANHTVTVRPTHIERRRSADIFALEDEQVAAAVQFIHKNAREPIQVSDVAREAALSPRALYSRFHKYLGRSVYEEIKRVRIKEISQMLLSTDLPVYQIALCFNFSSIEHIGRYFKSYTGISPLAYRKRFSTRSFD
ncbi:xylose operon transcription regulator XylR [Sedimentisphaera salicampi]|uniref:Xylose operon regulatory protein n=1 Tax=Sedimentisphaera salicampi TaxID=1941349 RepID=A0A1W6LMY7_9BACT|nr:DNA-binding transcriptional regulator [Sedimentisphaera salicampi]ARN57103.1 Xylose operon regulatory protein [Sedimentisphaera salicampi]OXU14942.1 Xylose operon regulatory protein [Sedimentisphaera salicampi]